MNDLILNRTDGAVRTIILNRTAKKNALNRGMYDQFIAAIGEAEEDETVAVIVIAGSGDNFSVGNDIDDFLAAPPPMSRERGPGGLFAALAHAQKPVLAAVNGMAVGIGTTLLLHCDLVYVGASARLRLPFVSIGLVPEGSSSLLLPQVLGRRRQRGAVLRRLGRRSDGLGVGARQRGPGRFSSGGRRSGSRAGFGAAASAAIARG